MIEVTQLRRGVVFEFKGNLYKVNRYNHHQPGRGHAIIRVNVRDLRKSSNLDLTFSSGERVQDIRLEARTHQYLYDDGEFYIFMDTKTFEQHNLPHSTMENHRNFLRENMELDILTYNDEVIDYEMPLTMDFEVIEAENAVAGDTATGATKQITTETGLKVRTPLFVKVGDHIRVSTESGEYLSRA